MKLDSELNQCREAARRLATVPPEKLRQVLLRIADLIDGAHEQILAANAKDLSRMDPADPKYDRLRLDPERLAGIAADTRSVADLPCPVGEVLEERALENGLRLSKVRVPIGVVAVIYESRPNVTVDVVALCLRTGNAAVLKGSRDAADSNRALVDLLHRALAEFDLPAGAVYLAPAEREALKPILEATEYIDLAIPRGSQGLIDFVRDNARVPVIETGAGICHTYVDAAADLEMARAVVTNAKTRRVSVCNALDTLVVHAEHLAALPDLLGAMGDQGVEVFADERAYAALEGRYAGPLDRAMDESFGQEFLAMKMSIKTVHDLDEALDHIARYSSRHSEAIVTEDAATAERFLAEVDAAAVYHNASTAFTDGAQFGMGA
ncbi:MAG: glutamate-5-semialdehyde dehydrogenase, partial [Candidatus Competibacterales bacterium]|nr:glutamate-5-semialdehyde dehydrogenase [Candidatus Competibacterales bacterium]